jgi:hypothetical protein
LVILVIGLGSTLVWSFLQTSDARSDLDGKIAVAVEQAKKAQSEQDNANFVAEQKKQTLTYTGPSDLGSVTFDYQKTWSVYLAKSGSKDSDFVLQLNPVLVNGDSSVEPAVTVSVINDSYDETVLSYQNQVDKGKLRATPVTISGSQGIRFDGELSSSVANGSLVVLKIRDKSLTIQLGVADYQADYAAILKSLTFKP